MPSLPQRRLHLSAPVDLSIVEFDLADFELFLTYTWALRDGPGIRRTGSAPPDIQVVGHPHLRTTHPFGLRLGTWLIHGDLRQDELVETRAALDIAQRHGAPDDDVLVLNDAVAELRNVQAHDVEFTNQTGGRQIAGQQGCGDLTMNAWKVAYVNNELAENGPSLVCLSDEPLDRRVYTAIIKWRFSNNLAMSIEDVRFARLSAAGATNKMVFVRYGRDWLPRADDIELAIASPRVLAAGNVIPAAATCSQFGDLRHLVRMPNMNPNRPLHRDEAAPYLPREYFDADQYGDMWFGEKAFLDDLRSATGNLLPASLCGPVFLAFPPGSNKERLRGALALAGYRETEGGPKTLGPGEWRFTDRAAVSGDRRFVVEVHLERNVYGWSMVGLSRDRRRMLWFAAAGLAGRTGYTLEQAAELFRQAGAWDALLIDEGNDVFQTIDFGNGLQHQVPLKRRRLRATVIASRRQPDGDRRGIEVYTAKG